mgnify:CR=1 FL=1
MDELLKRLNRYSRQCLTERTDPDFADAVEEAKRDLKDLRNEFCNKCGKYKTAHLGSCDGCRWKDGG